MSGTNVVKDTPARRFARVEMIRTLQKRARWWEGGALTDEEREELEDEDMPGILEEAQGVLKVVSACIKAGTPLPASEVPNVGTACAAAPLLSTVAKALASIRANTPIPPPAADIRDTFSALHYLVDPLLFSFTKEGKRYGEDDDDGMPILIPTVYTHKGGAGFAPSGYINGVQLCDAQKGFDEATRKVLEAAYPLLSATTCFGAPAGDGGAHETAEVVLTDEEKAEVASATAAMIADNGGDDQLADGSATMQLVGRIHEESPRSGVRSGAEWVRCDSTLARLTADLDVSSKAFLDTAITEFAKCDPITTKTVRSHFNDDATSDPKDSDGDSDSDPEPKKKRRKTDPQCPWEMCFAGNLSALKRCLWVCGGTVDYVHKERGTTMLYTACRFGHEDVARYLLELGANPNVANTAAGSASSPLHGAAFGAHPTLVALLLEFGADSTATNTHGDTPLKDASTNSSPAAKKCIKLLKEHTPVQTDTQDLSPPALLLQILKEKGGDLKAAFLSAYHTMRTSEYESASPDLREVVKRRRRMQSYCAGKETVGEKTKKKMSVSWQAMDVNLNAENPIFYGADMGRKHRWGGDSTVATAMLVVSVENVTPPSASFFETIPDSWINDEEDHSVTMPLGFGAEHYNNIRVLGELPLAEGTLATWNRHTRHTFSPMQIKDVSKPARLTVLYLWVHDPTTTHLTTDTYPDQSQWVSKEDALRNSRDLQKYY